MPNGRFMYWVGMNTAPDLSADDEKQFTDFYSQVHMREVVSLNPGFFRATRYELLHPDPRNNHGPRWLVVYEMESEDAARGYIERDENGTKQAFTPGLKVGRSVPEGKWRLMWRRLTPRDGEMGAGGAEYISLIGMSVAPGTDEAGVKEFNDFYTDTHIPEVVANGQWQRGTRYDLYHAFVHDGADAPEYLALYEGDEVAMETRARRLANPAAAPKSSAGPPAWDARDTVWRLTYRRIASWAKSE